MPPKNVGNSRTLVLLKPDAIERNLAGEILKRFERKGLKIVAAQMRWIDLDLAGEHYAEHKGNGPHFSKMTEALTAGPLMAIVLEGPNAVQASRQLIGSQSPLYHSQIGTIRADLAIHEPYNLVHGADSDHAATREITLWFGKDMVKPDQPQPKKVEAKLAPAIPMPAMPPVPKKNAPNFDFDFADLDGSSKVGWKVPTPMWQNTKPGEWMPVNNELTLTAPNPEELDKYKTQLLQFISEMNKTTAGV